MPPKVTQKYLVSTGFKSTDDRRLINLGRDLGFLDGAGVPTNRWRDYRDRTAAGSVLAGAVKETYENLFQMFPDAQLKDDEALRNFFSAETDLGKDAIDATVRTFKTVCGFADFDVEPSSQQPAQEESSTVTVREQPNLRLPGMATGMTVNINVQLQLPATDDPAIYENLFEALRKHLIAG